MSSLYSVDFPAIKVKRAAGDYWSSHTQRHAEDVLAKTKPRMKKFLFIFDDGMETWLEAFERTWGETFRYGLAPGAYWRGIAKELYEHASKLKPTELMRLNDEAVHIVTYFD